MNYAELHRRVRELEAELEAQSAHYADALFEVYCLRGLLVHEANQIRETSTYYQSWMSIPTSVRNMLKRSAERMTAAANGGVEQVWKDHPMIGRITKGMSLTQQEWENRPPWVDSSNDDDDDDDSSNDSSNNDRGDTMSNPETSNSEDHDPIRQPNDPIHRTRREYTTRKVSLYDLIDRVVTTESSRASGGPSLDASLDNEVLATSLTVELATALGLSDPPTLEIDFIEQYSEWCIRLPATLKEVDRLSIAALRHHREDSIKTRYEDGHLFVGVLERVQPAWRSPSNKREYTISLPTELLATLADSDDVAFYEDPDDERARALAFVKTLRDALTGTDNVAQIVVTTDGGDDISVNLASDGEPETADDLTPLREPACDTCGDKHENAAFTNKCDRHDDCIVTAECGSTIIEHTQPDHTEKTEKKDQR